MYQVKNGVDTMCHRPFIKQRFDVGFILSSHRTSINHWSFSPSISFRDLRSRPEIL